MPEESKRQSKTAFRVLVVTFALSIVLLVVFRGGHSDSVQLDFGLADVVGQTFGWVILLMAMFVGLKIDGLGWRELQYRRTHLLPSLILGTLVGAVFLICADKSPDLRFLLTASGIFAILQFLIVGLAEETLFRGYVQVRWVAALGWWRGWLLASATMSLFHVPILLLGENLSILEVLLETLRLLPLSLLLGYAMRKSGNIVAPAIIHLWLNLIPAL
ncbi:MAG: CPBP family intramembrane metalloprotease [Gemmatimonadales bacterium]|nr:CPBP family intramembrane metalloprotease [Gemmatimonadales bacterium]